jgi:hypothetical protein
MPCVLVEAPAEIRWDGGMVKFDLTSGDETIHYAMSANHFLASFRRAAEVAHEWRGGGAEIVTVQFDSKFERVFDPSKADSG